MESDQMNCVRRLWVLVVILGFFLSLPVHSQSTPPQLTLDDCVSLALSAPSSVVLARQQSDIANFGLKEAKAAFLPQAQFNSGFVYNSPLAGNSAIQSFLPLNGVREYAFMLGTSEELDLSGRLRANKQRASADLDAARVGENLSQRDLKRAVSASYYRLLLVRHIALALADSVAEAESFEQRTRLLLDNGEASEADLAKASAEVSALRQALSSADLDARLANQQLASFWTTAVNDRLPVVDVFDAAVGPAQPDNTASSTRPYANRPEFNLLDAQKRSFLAESRRIRATLLPQANVAFEYGLDSSIVRARDRGYALFVNLNVPIFDWMRTLNASREFRARADQITTQQSVAERAFSREYEDAQERLKNALEQITLAVTQIQLTGEDLRLSRIRFEGGEGPALDVVAAQSQLTQARVSHFTAISNYWNALADLEVAAGR
jgi:outer membrane protein TolC